jgi:hypothetical protein
VRPEEKTWSTTFQPWRAARRPHRDRPHDIARLAATHGISCEKVRELLEHYGADREALHAAAQRARASLT